MINFDHELQDRSTFRNHAIHEFTNQQLLFAEGKDVGLSFAVNFNPASNSTYDKLWIPFSNSTQIIYDTPSGFSIFTRINPLLLSFGSTQTTPPPAAGPAPLTNRMRYYGGPVCNKYNVAIYNIWWGSAYNSGTAQDRRQTLQSQMNTICSSDFFTPFWQYLGIKKPVVGGNVVHTQTSIPSGDEITFEKVQEVIEKARDLGQVPDWDANGEATTPEIGIMDLKHRYHVIIPMGKVLPPGFGAGSDVSYTHQNTPGTPGTVWYMYCGQTPPDPSVTGTHPGQDIIQRSTEMWTHETIHHLESAAVALACPPSSALNGRAGFLYVDESINFCSDMIHTNCGSRYKTLSGSSIMVPSIWSDMDGTCVAAGTGDNWTRPPAGGTGPPPPPVDPNTRRYIFQKMDDLDNAATASIGPDGTVYFSVKKAGIEYKVKSTPAALVINQWADMWFTFDSTANQARMYINNFLHNTASSEVPAWNNTHSHFILANNNLGASAAQFRGRMDDFRLYRSAVVNSTDVDNLNNNGLTVTGIESTPEQGVFIVNRVKIDKKLDNTSVYVPGDVASGDVPAATASFTTTSFSSTSFTL